VIVCTEQHRFTAYGVLAAAQIHFLEFANNKINSNNKIFTYNLKPNEVAVACASCRLGPQSDKEESSAGAATAMAVEDSSALSGAGIGGRTDAANTEYIVIGTAVTPKGDLDSRSGRVLIFEIVTHQHIIDPSSATSTGAEKIVRLVCEKEFGAAVMAVTSLRGKLAVGLGGKIQLFNFLTGPNDVFDPASGNSTAAQPSTSSSTSTSLRALSSSYPQLQASSSHTGHVMCLYLKASGNYLLAGDLVRSMSVLQLKENGDLVELARDFSCNSMRAIEILGDGSEFYLGADDAGNLIVDKRNSSVDAATDEERSKLAQFGEFHLGDHINVFRFGLLNGQPIGSDNASLIPSINLNNLGTASATGTSSVLAGSTGSDTPSSAADSNYRKCLLFGTVSGAIGSVFFLDDDTFRLVMFCRLSSLCVTPEPVLHLLGSFRIWRKQCERLCQRSVASLMKSSDDSATSAAPHRSAISLTAISSSISWTCPRPMRNLWSSSSART
jgi:hypothetical protein